MIASSEVETGHLRSDHDENEGTIHTWMCDVCKTAKFDDYDEACRHEVACRKKKEESTIKHDITNKKKQRTNAPIGTQATKVHAFFTGVSQKCLQETSNAGDRSKAQLSISDDSTKGSRTRKKRKLSRMQVTSETVVDTNIVDKSMKQNTQSGNLSVHSVADSKANLDIQISTDSADFSLASIFGTKNKDKIMEEQIAVEVAAARRMKERASRTIVSLQPSLTRDAPRERAKRSILDRFPISSHVGASVRESSVSSRKYSQVLTKLRITPRLWTGGTRCNNDVSPYHHIPVPAGPADVDFYFQILSSALIPPKEIDLLDNDLWSKKYSIRKIPEDVCGASNQEVGSSCVDFVDEWKLERLKAHSRRADKQEQLARGKKRRRIQVADDLWDDDSDDDQLGLPSICLLTGPVGCGKTSLVHAVARTCDCEVMEINTTVKRSSQNMKNYIEEATQSDSTMDMLKNRISHQPFLSKKYEDLIDSDDEQCGEAGSRVPVILIDEVDLLFEDDGDLGFWTALKALSKKAKCPIFLTASALPYVLYTLSVRFKHFKMERPTPEECSITMNRVIQSEKIGQCPSLLPRQVNRALHAFAEMCKCDVRRILLELQLFVTSKRCVLRIDADSLVSEKASPTLGSCSADDGPIIRKITLEQMHLRVDGMGFDTMPSGCLISIGEQICEATVVDNTTITAICRPIKGYGDEKYSCRFPVINVKYADSRPRLVLGSRFQNLALCESSNMPTLSVVNFEYVSQSMCDHDLNDESEESKSEYFSTQMGVHYETSTLPDKVKPMDSPKLVTKAKPIFEVSETIDLSLLAQKLDYRSDAAWIEDSKYVVPCLSGATRGFASHFVEGFGPLSAFTEPSKPHSVERILLSGWNDHECFFGESDVYFTNPSRRDRQLFSQVARFGRQSSFNSSIQSSAEDNVDVNEQDDTETKHFPCPSDADSFLLRETSLHQLPSIMLSLLQESLWHDRIISQLRSERRKCRMRSTKEFFRWLWHDQNASQVFCKGVERDVYDEEQLDERIRLDYGPILSQICAFEEAAISLAEAAVKLAQPSSRRVTRRSKELAHAHYIGKVNQGLCEEDCRRMGTYRVKCLLRY